MAVCLGPGSVIRLVAPEAAEVKIWHAAPPQVRFKPVSPRILLRSEWLLIKLARKRSVLYRFWFWKGDYENIKQGGKRMFQKGAAL